MRRDPHANVVLNEGAARTGSQRFAAPADLEPYVEWCWEAWWDLGPGGRHVVEILTDPGIHVVFEPAGANVVGVATRVFERVLEGTGRVLGVKFKAGAFRAFTHRRARDLTDRRLPLGDVIACDPAAANAAVLAERDGAARAAVAEAFVRARLPAPAPEHARVRALYARIERDRELASVEALARAEGISIRTLQRLFDEYVGASPKWVIQRCRLLEAAERLRDGTAGPLVDLATSLGYFDQAHFTHELKAVTGRTPSELARR